MVGQPPSTSRAAVLQELHASLRDLARNSNPPGQLALATRRAHHLLHILAKRREINILDSCKQTSLRRSIVPSQGVVVRDRAARHRPIGVPNINGARPRRVIVQSPVALRKEELELAAPGIARDVGEFEECVYAEARGCDVGPRNVGVFEGERGASSAAWVGIEVGIQGVDPPDEAGLRDGASATFDLDGRALGQKREEGEECGGELHGGWSGCFRDLMV